MNYKLKRIFSGRDAVPFCASLLFGFAAHMYMLTNKIPMDDDICNFFTKGATTISGRWGLELLRPIMPDISMPWIYGVMTLLFLALTVCVTVRLFDIKSKTMQALLAGLIVCFPAEIGTMSYMFTAAPYALAMLMAIGSVWVFESNTKSKWILAPLLLIFSCSIYQSYFGFAASFCVLLMIKRLLEGEDAKKVLVYGLKLLAFLVLSVGIYAVTVVLAGRIAAVPVLDVANKEQGILMCIAVAYSAYLHTIFDGYFAYVNGSAAVVMHLIIIAVAGVGIILTAARGKNARRILLLFLCLLLLPLSCYCLYMMADNGYIHSLALYPFATLYVLCVLIIDRFMPDKLNALRWCSAVAMVAIILGNVYFANSFYLYSQLQYKSRTAFYTSMLTQVMQTEGFEPGTRLAIIGEYAALDYDLDGDFPFEQFQLPGNNIMNPIHAEDIIKNYLGCDIPFADEEQCSSLAQTEEFSQMPVYPYYGSVRLIDGCVVVRLSDIEE